MTELPRFLLGTVRSVLWVQTSGGQKVARVGEAMACTHHWALQPSSYMSPLPSSVPVESQSLQQRRRRGEATRVPRTSQLDKTGEF